jgi:hypothetical protein
MAAAGAPARLARSIRGVVDVLIPVRRDSAGHL